MTLQITFLSALFLTALGYLLTKYGVHVDNDRKNGTTTDYAALQFSGVIIAAIFWVCYNYRQWVAGHLEHPVRQ